MLLKVRKITNAIYRGLDLARRSRSSTGWRSATRSSRERPRAGGLRRGPHAWRQRGAARLALRQVPGDRPGAPEAEHFDYFLSALEHVAQEMGLGRLIVPAYSAYFAAYQTLVERGYQIDYTMVRMKRGSRRLRGPRRLRARRLALREGRASHARGVRHAEGTDAYARRLAGRAAPGHFRVLDGRRASSLGIGTYLGGEEDATDAPTATPWWRPSRAASTSSTPR